MKNRLIVVLMIIAILAVALGVVGQAYAGSTTDTIIKDAGDGTLDGNYTAAQIQAALAYLSANPVATQYSGSGGVLEDYLASLQAPGSQSGSLAFTGGELYAIFAAGLALVAGGWLLRRRSRSTA